MGRTFILGNVLNGSFAIVESKYYEMLLKCMNLNRINIGEAKKMFGDNFHIIEELCKVGYLSKSDITDEAESSKPIVAYYHITDMCNYNCIGCYSADSRLNNNKVSFKDVISILNYIYNLGVETLVISGGEPFLLSNLAEILFYAKKKIRL